MMKNIAFFWVSHLLLAVSPAWAGVPPTASRVTGESADVVTYKFRFPNFTGTRTGRTLSLGVNSVAGGGTGASTATAAFNALSPLTTKGDLIARDTTNGIRVPVGTDGQVLTADSVQASGIRWAAPATAPDQSYEIANLGVAASVAANALTIALKTKAGTDPAAGDSVKIGFRNATAATGTYAQRTVTAALSTVISSGSTAGHASGVNEYLYVYAIDNLGTVELAWSSTRFDEGSPQSTTAEGGAGAADSKTVLYSTTARANVPVRLIGRLRSNQTTAGTWAAAPNEISISPILVESVMSNSAGLERIERAWVTGSGFDTSCAVSSTCQITAQSGSWVTSVTSDASPVYVATLASGIFSARPTCTCSANQPGTSVRACTALASSSTSVTVWAHSGGASASVTPAQFNLICMGPR